MKPHLDRIVLPWISTGLGGGEKSVPELAQALAEQGVHVDLVWWSYNDDAAKPPAPHDVRVSAVNSWEQYRDALTMLAAYQDDTVVISSHRTAAADVTIAGRTPVLAALRGIAQHDRLLRVLDPGTGRIESLYPRQMPGGLLAKAHWIGISQASAASAALLPGVSEAATIYNGVQLPLAYPSRRPRRANRLRVAVVARTVPWKRVDDVVRAAADPQLIDRIQVNVYGQPASHQPELNRLVSSLAAPVIFHGYVDKLHHRLMENDVLVSPSPEEGFGRCVVDGAGARLPALVPDIGAGPEVVLHGITGLVYQPGQLTAALIHAADAAPAYLARMGSAASARALAWYTPQRCAAQYLNTAYSLVAREGTR